MANQEIIGEIVMNIKVRKDFDPTKHYSVAVEDCTVKEKKEVQQAFFDAGILWRYHGAEYLYIGAKQYSNKHAIGGVQKHLLYGSTTERCNMTAKEFLELVYEPEQQGYVHAELILQFGADALTHTEPWKLWQFKVDDGVWCDCPRNPHWRATTEYRRKPKTHFVHGVEIPDLRVSPELGDKYYLADPTSPELTDLHTFVMRMEKMWGERGLCYQNTDAGRRAAIAHSKAMLGIV